MTGLSGADRRAAAENRAKRAVVSDDNETIRLMLYGADGAPPAVAALDPFAAGSVACDLLQAALRHLRRRAVNPADDAPGAYENAVRAAVDQMRGGRELPPDSPVRPAGAVETHDRRCPVHPGWLGLKPDGTRVCVCLYPGCPWGEPHWPLEPG